MIILEAVWERKQKCDDWPEMSWFNKPSSVSVWEKQNKTTTHVRLVLWQMIVCVPYEIFNYIRAKQKRHIHWDANFSHSPYPSLLLLNENRPICTLCHVPLTITHLLTKCVDISTAKNITWQELLLWHNVEQTVCWTAIKQNKAFPFSKSQCLANEVKPYITGMSF